MSFKICYYDSFIENNFAINTKCIEWVKSFDVPQLSENEGKHRLEIKTITSKFISNFSNEEERNKKFNEIILNI